jgi:flagellar basal-body rod modification protein FlgD
MEKPMSIFATTSTGQASSAAQPASNPFGFVEGAHFMQLLLAQLRNQNPLDPMQDKDMMGQLAQINSLQELQKINTALQSMAASTQLTNAAGLIGKTVQFPDEEGALQSGVVTGVSMVDGQIMLSLGEQLIPLWAVISVNAGDGASEDDGDSESDGGSEVGAVGDAGQVGE